MRRDHPIFPFAEVNPDYDLDVTALLVSYCVGDDRDPDEVIDLKGRGDFRIDSTLRDAIRAIPLDSTDHHLSTDDLDVQEMGIPPQGPGMAYQIEVWLQTLPPDIAKGLIIAGIVGGCSGFWQKYRKPPPAQSNPAENAPEQSHTFTTPPQQQLLDYAKSIVVQHYTIQGDLTDVNVNLSESSSESKFSGAALLSANDGRTFEVSIDYDNDGLRQSRIVRKHPEP